MSTSSNRYDEEQEELEHEERRRHAAYRHRQHVVSETAAALSTLARNLAVAGALCRAHELGHPDIFDVTRNGETYTDWRMRWSPNVDGKAAP